MRISEFQDILYEDLAWRKVEISQLFMMMNTNELKEIVGKSLILLLYAHWEGFIKNSSKYYLIYISNKNIKLQELTDNFEAIMLKKYAGECISLDSLNLAKEFALLDRQRRASSSPFKINIDVDNEHDIDLIDTQHNLSSKVFKNIIQIIGINYNTAIQTRETYLDKNLLNYRNSIGHGNKLNIDLQEEISPLEYDQIKKLKDFVVSLLDYYSEVLLTYVEKEYYLKRKEKERSEFEKIQEERLNRKLETMGQL